MKKLLYIVLILVLLVGACQPPKESTDGGMQVYENKEFSFKISYPDSWTKEETGTTQPIVNFVAPKKGDEAVEGVNVGIADIPEEIKVDDFKDAVLQDLKTNFPDATINTEQTTVGKIPGYKIEYTVKSVQLIQSFAIKDSKVYVLSAITNADKSEQNKPLFNSVFSSFEFK